MLNPVLTQGLRPEQPVERPNVLGAIGNLAGIFLDAQNSRPQPRELSQPERDNLALQPFANRMADLAESVPVGSRGNIARVAQSDYSTFVRQNPGLAPEAKDIMSSVLGIETTPVETDPNQAIVEEMNNWIATPEGQIAYLSSVTLNSAGEVDTEGTSYNLRASFLNRQAEEARLAQTKRQLDQSQSDVALWKSQSEMAMSDYLPAWTQESEQFVTSMASMISSGNETVDTWDEQMAFLREYRRVTRNSFRSRALTGGMHPDVIEAQIDRAIAPIDEAIQLMEDFTGDQEAFLKLIKNTSETNITTSMLETFGSVAGLPAFREEAARIMASDKLYDQGMWTQAIEYFKNLGAQGITSPLDLFSRIPDTVEEATIPESISNPSVVLDMRSKGEDYILDTLDTAGIALSTMPIENLGTPSGQEAILGHVGMMVNGADASDTPLGVNQLNNLLTPSSVRILASMASQSTQTGIDTKNALTSFFATQSRRNEAQINDALLAMPEGFNVVYDNGAASVELDLEKLLGTTEGRDFNTYVRSIYSKDADALTDSELQSALGNYRRMSWGSKLRGIQQNIDSYNFLNQAVRRIIPEYTEFQQSHGPVQPGLGPVLNLLDRVEGGGDYGALYDFSNRSGPFTDVDITKMTIGQLREFSNPSGEYGQWVKDRIGYVSTPMGRYQFVGTTLNHLVEKLGIPDNALFTPALQDAIFNEHLKEVLGRSSTMAGKRAALRSEWEGFAKKNANGNYIISDAELDVAILSIQQGVPIDLEGVIQVPSAAFETEGIITNQPPAVSTPTPNQVEVTPRQIENLQEVLNINAFQASMVASVIMLSNGQLTSEGQGILRKLGIEADSNVIMEAMSGQAATTAQ